MNGQSPAVALEKPKPHNYNAIEAVDVVNVLPKADELVIPIEKFTKYALDPKHQPHKAVAFNRALGYNLTNTHKLIENIRKNVLLFPAKIKGNKGHGNIYEVKMNLLGENGKTAKVVTGWLDDDSTGEMRLTTAYVDKWRGGLK